MHKRKVAVFDFDGTITKRDTFFPFMLSYGVINVLDSLPKALFQKNDQSLRDNTKANLIRKTFAGYSVEKFLEDGIRYANRIENRLRKETLRCISDHRNQGHQLVMITASLGSYTRPLGSRLGFDHVFAVELETIDDFLTGEMIGDNVRGVEKARLLKKWLGEETSEVWGYGNSKGDSEMLAMADHQIWI
jgi:HAD superfamily hydrolase (TIGR01490 family)